MKKVKRDYFWLVIWLLLLIGPFTSAPVSNWMWLAFWLAALFTFRIETSIYHAVEMMIAEHRGLLTEPTKPEPRVRWYSPLAR